MDLLQVKGNQIVNAQGQPVRLRGTAIGGWMNMENFINGYAGNESGVRQAAAEILGPRTAEFLFERWLDYFLSEDDIRFIKQTGANVIRPALNYRHFESDAEPFTYDERAFARDQYASILLFRWGVQELPVFLTQVQIEAKEYLPQLLPYRAEATLTMQIIESNNPIYQAELKRQFALAGSTQSATP